MPIAVFGSLAAKAHFVRTADLYANRSQCLLRAPGRINLGIIRLKNHRGPSWFAQGRPQVKKTREMLHLFYADEGSITVVTVAFEFDSDGVACDQTLRNDLRVGNG